MLKAYRDLAASTAFDRLTGLYAFASRKGVLLLSSVLKTSPSWRGSSKRRVISVDGGITEPDALRFLLRQYRTEVRVPDAERMLMRSLRPTHRFHPKTLLLERQVAEYVPTAIMVGSANLTCSGLCFGHEHAMSARAVAGSDITQLIDPNGFIYLEQMIETATVIDDDFVDRYSKVLTATRKSGRHLQTFGRNSTTYEPT